MKADKDSTLKMGKFIKSELSIRMARRVLDLATL